jgi:hypothetical protein
MSTPDTNHGGRGDKLEHMAEEVFSSEKREDVWAIIIALLVLVFSMLFPEQIYTLFHDSLYFF